MHLEKQTQVGALLWNKALTKVMVEYSDYKNIFSAKNIMELLENNRMNEHTIELEEDKQPLFKPIYSLSPVELEILKTYIETNMANGFIFCCKSPTGTLILFDKKPDESLHLCVNYRSLNNITIKNWYPLPLIEEIFDWLGRPMRFTQLDLTNTYYRMTICEGHE